MNVLCVISFKYQNELQQPCGSVAEWSKALVLGTSLSGGVGSNPTAASVLLFAQLHIAALFFHMLYLLFDDTKLVR